VVCGDVTVIVQDDIDILDETIMLVELSCNLIDC
jgi:hypothetical protein